MNRRTMLTTSALAVVAALSLSATLARAEETLKIGFVGVTSGPAAAWGTSTCARCRRWRRC
ncbi:hypothetical protein [Rhodobacter capsulatus]|uniref:hypothetical protein n=1 Tax=Rhodobacter capsulatus TaxID=1061 RepID=UPI0040282052